MSNRVLIFLFIWISPDHGRQACRLFDPAEMFFSMSWTPNHYLSPVIILFFRSNFMFFVACETLPFFSFSFSDFFLAQTRLWTSDFFIFFHALFESLYMLLPISFERFFPAFVHLLVFDFRLIFSFLPPWRRKSGGVSKEADRGAYFCTRQPKKVKKHRRFSSLFLKVLKDGGGFREARGLKIPAAVVIFIFIISIIVSNYLYLLVLPGY